LRVPENYDGDGKTDLALYQPSTGKWFISDSISGFGGIRILTFGGSEYVPVN